MAPPPMGHRTRPGSFAKDARPVVDHWAGLNKAGEVSHCEIIVMGGGPPVPKGGPPTPQDPSHTPHLVLLTGPNGEEPRTRSCSTPPSVDLSYSRPEGVK